MKRVVVVTQLVGLLGILVIYLILIASSIMGVVHSVSRLYATLIAVVATLPLIHFRGLGYVAYLSMIGVAVLCLVVIAVPVGSIVEITHSGGHVAPLEVPSLSTAQAF